ncbi:MAG: phage protease [Sodalis sp. (in: enterobacteria)]|uniref:phage protease n=1 Tax=Sodalis sp. (in: enterobacteria) TaxID=1898979 RepID=UPI003F3E32AB
MGRGTKAICGGCRMNRACPHPDCRRGVTALSPRCFSTTGGNVSCLANAALTNVPALDGMAALLAATSQQLTGENNVDELLEQLRWMLNLPLSATPEEVTVELKKLIDRLLGGQGTAAARINLLSLLGEKDNQIAALSQQTSTPTDPAAYAPLSVANELREQVAALGRQLNGNEVTALLTAALSDGLVLKGADEDWARRLGEKDVALLREHLATRQPIARCRGCRPAATRRWVSRRGHRFWAHWMRRRWPGRVRRTWSCSSTTA